MPMPPPVIHRHEVPVDDAWHVLDLPRGILHIATRRQDVVEVWAYARQDDDQPSLRQFRAYATGQPTPISAVHVGTAITPGGELVWHLLENCCQHLTYPKAQVQPDPDRPELCAGCGGPLA